MDRLVHLVVRNLAYELAPCVGNEIKHLFGLVLDLCVGVGHSSIPFGIFLIEVLAHLLLGHV